MKLLFSSFSPPISLEEGCVCSLIVENPPMFRCLVADMQQQIAGAEGECILSDEGKPLDMGKYAELFVQLIPFSCNRKTLLNRVFGAVEQTAQDTGHYERTRTLFAAIERYLLELGEEYALTLNAEKLTAAGLLKLTDASIEEDGADPLGAMLDYMDLVAELEREKLFIFVTLRTYFADGELQLFLDGSAHRKHRVLLLEGTERPLLNGEKRVVIDVDLCEITCNPAPI